MAQKHGSTALSEYNRQHETVRQNAQKYDQDAIHGNITPIYRFGENVLEGDDLDMTDTYLSIKGLKTGIDLNIPNPFL